MFLRNFPDWFRPEAFDEWLQQFEAIPEAVRAEARRQAIEKVGEGYREHSNFPVSASIVTSTLHIAHGCNIENASFGLTVCAERVGIFKAVPDIVATAGGHILLVVVYAPKDKTVTPCGACLQVIREFGIPEKTLVWTIGDLTGECDMLHRFDFLMAKSFGPDNLKQAQ